MGCELRLHLTTTHTCPPSLPLSLKHTSLQHMAKKDDLTKMEDKLTITIRDNKKLVDSTLNGIITRLSKLEKETEAFNKEKEKWRAEKEKWEMEMARERTTWQH